MERRVIKTEPFKTREENGKRYLDGYYSVFNREYEVSVSYTHLDVYKRQP